MKKWYDEEYEFTVEVTGFLHGKYSKTVVCPDGCVIFKLTATPLGNENFHKGGFWDYPDETVK